MLCNSISTPQLFFFSESAPMLLYYSHLPSIFISLLIGILVYRNNKKELPNIILFILSICFSTWAFLNLILWTNNNSDLIIFTWSFFGILYGLISVFSIYLTHVFLYKKDTSFYIKTVLSALLIPLIVFAPSKYNLSGFDFNFCGSSGFENITYLTYYTSLGILAMIWIFAMLIHAYRQSPNKQDKKLCVYFGTGIEFFLVSFFFSSFLASYLNDIGLSEDYSLEFYGLFGMTAFMSFLAFLIVRFKAFNTKLLGAQALTWSLIILISSQIFFIENNTNKILISITLVITSIIGLNLIRSVKKEVQGKEELEELTTHLEKANTRLRELDQQKSEFISLASHQLRGPLTAIKGYGSLILEGDFGTLTPEVKEAVETMYKSTQALIVIVGDYLDVSRIEQGRMKYDFTDFSLQTLIKTLTEELEPSIKISNLSLTFTSTPNEDFFVHADQGKIKQVIGNLIDNSIKYTKQGNIKISLSRIGDRITTTIQDTGVGIIPEVKPRLFEKFTRAPDASKTNIMGTGLGLYVAKKMIEAHQGKIWAESEGKDKGSTFFIELEAARKNKPVPNPHIPEFED